jgi:hypothetical protein
VSKIRTRFLAKDPFGQPMTPVSAELAAHIDGEIARTRRAA